MAATVSTVTASAPATEGRLTTEIELEPSTAPGRPPASSNTSLEAPDSASTEDKQDAPNTTRATGIVVALCGVSCLNTLGSGILTIALPKMAKDLDLPQDLLLWPASVYALSAGCLLLLFGNLGDIFGPKVIWVLGSFLFLVFTLACGLSQTAAQLITFRTVLGLAIAMCLPTAPLGYSVGLILGGVFADTIGWRYGYYISAILNAPLCAIAIWALPAPRPKKKSRRVALLKDIDWTGTVLISASLGFLSYALARLSQSYQGLSNVATAVLFALSIALFPVFVFWMRYQERRQRPAIVPISLWKNAIFSTICGVVFLCWGVFNAFQYFTSLYLQLVQDNTALQTSIRFIPMAVVGAATNILTGFLVDKVRVRPLVVASAVITTASPIIMAFSEPSWNYWLGPFFAITLSPLHPDVLFTVSNLVVSAAYPGESQGLAGAVFNTISQLGNSVGLAVLSAIASSVTAHDADKSLQAGYRVAYWIMFAAMVVVILASWLGLRKAEKAG
ncbi:uncharacterized protein LTR77_009892 [Saxophila tyrrhenica]|uniref:Major facilitator superfamily (MFS) profile domain-containing protein n=1 Tax=Saxophila tyrrhenica TaxID=1690608 RepID=A0AAV9P061_9PEZI|nr:hypothetical protein LTR77_009892 [Saxophila tyrrhenica]